MLVLKRNPALLLSLVISISSPVYAQDAGPSNEHEPDRVHGASHEHDELEEVMVTATPLSRNIVEMSQSATVLSGAALDREVSNNLGETLARVPGLSNASFGQNVGRPVIRGFEGARVGVLNNNMASADASAVSQDHAVAVEPFLADQIEVLRGPATLLYGSGAIGGVVNMVTHTIPQAMPEKPFTARALVQADSGAEQQFAAGRLDAGEGSWAFHASGFYRRTDDYDIPGSAELYHEDEDLDDEEGTFGTLDNSFLDNEGASLGASWLGESWRGGLSFSRYSSDYGIPGVHGYLDEGGETAPLSEDEELVTIGLESDRVDGEIVGQNPFAGFDQFKLRFASSDYNHTEFEGSEIGTVFTNETKEGRIELRHVPVGVLTGAMGIQYTDRKFDAVGEEAFVPASHTRAAAVFWVESAEFERLQLDAGLRYDDIEVRADTHSDRNFSPFSASLGAVLHLNEAAHVTANIARAERAPSDQELFALGPHIATQTFEVGDPTLNTESNLHVEAGVRLHHGALTGSLVFYRDDFDDYIYQVDVGVEQDGLPVRNWSQLDAVFKGAELELRYDLGRQQSGHWQLFGFADTVKAELSDGSNVPRMPPRRFGLGVDWDRQGWAANVTWISASSQNRIADFETPTPGYDLLNADMSYLLPTNGVSEWELFLKGHNLLDEDIRNSTSFLKDQAPQIGRNFVFGVRAYF
jgi:iron complex outermembrane receptor protein